MVNKAINYILKNDATLTNLVGQKIYPIVIPEDTKAPVVVYMSDGMEPEYDKGGNIIDTDDVSVWAYALNYPKVTNVIGAVRNALELVKGNFNGVRIINSVVTKGEEGYDVDSDTYFQKMTFKIKTSKI